MSSSYLYNINICCHRDENYEELRLRRATQSYDNVEYIRPENHQGDVCGNTERPESNVYENVKY